MEIRSYILIGSAVVSLLGCVVIPFEKIAGSVFAAVGGATFLGALAYPSVKKKWEEYSIKKTYEKGQLQTSPIIIQHKRPSDDYVDWEFRRGKPHDESHP
jgi:hypothetical protein